MTVPRFWREIPQRYNLQASLCENCKEVHFPPRDVCPKCRRASIGRMARRNLKGIGRIVEWTRVHKAAPGFENQVPYVVALIQAEEGPVLTGQVVDTPDGMVRSGAWVQAVFRRLGSDGEDGVIYYGTKWKVVPDPTPVPDADEGKRRKK
jgi:uncharacterized OB-fold protein